MNCPFLLTSVLASHICEAVLSQVPGISSGSRIQRGWFRLLRFPQDTAVLLALQVLSEPFYQDRHDWIPEGQPPYYISPVFHYHGNR